MTWLSFTRILTAIAMMPYFLFNYIFNDYAYPAVSKSGAYVFCYFVGNEVDEQRIHLAVSTDGYNFEALNNNEPIILQTKGTGCVRDPYMLKGVDENGKDLPASPDSLIHLEKIVPPNTDFSKYNFTIACDVKNKLCGELGASFVYGFQKGDGNASITNYQQIQQTADVIKIMITLNMCF
mgnify:CR=1 FL=1